MSLFSAEGLIRAAVRGGLRGVCHIPTVVHRAYVRWLTTQGYDPPKLECEVVTNDEWLRDGWLIGLRALWSRRAPGNTCLSALCNAKKMGEPAKNDSKGCGGVMRAAPVGLVMTDPEWAFQLGSESAALTHGHPSGYLSAGFMAVLIEEIVSGASLAGSIQTAKQRLITQPDHEEVLNAVESAVFLAESDAPFAKMPVLGQGWVAEEALAIAVYCALVAPNFEEAVVLAVNHSGDSDSTGAIVGNICGALYGDAAIPARWLDRLELREEITAIADDLARVREDTLDMDNDQILERYPG